MLESTWPNETLCGEETWVLCQWQEGELEIHSTWALATRTPLPLPQEGFCFLPQATSSELSSLSMFQPSHLLCPAHQGRYLSSFLSLQQIHSSFSVLRTLLLWTEKQVVSVLGEVTKITTLGKPQRVKKAELQLPLAFTEVEIDQGQPSSEAFPRLIFFHGPTHTACNSILSLFYALA